MDSYKTRVIHSYCLSHAKNWSLFLVNQKANKGDIFRITRENLMDCFQSDEDENFPEVDEDTKRVDLTFSKIIQLSDNPDDDFLVFTFDEPAEESDTFILKPHCLANTIINDVKETPETEEHNNSETQPANNTEIPQESA